MIHRRADLYPEPGRFRPERFLGQRRCPDTYTWVPFGGGTRRCLGASFALMEMRIVLDRVLERCALAAVDADTRRRSVPHDHPRPQGRRAGALAAAGAPTAWGLTGAPRARRARSVYA